MNQQTTSLPESEVRQRQQSCFVNKLPESDLKDFDFNYDLNKKRVSLAVVMTQDSEDKSLQNYKKAVLGDIAELKDEPPEVDFHLMEVVFQNRPQGNIVLDLQFGLKDNEKHPFKIKEGEEYYLKLHFKVSNDCVIGLKLYNTIRRHGIKVESYEELIGSFPPKKHIQIVNLDSQVAPSGFLMRGHYNGKLLLVDSDGIVHLQLTYYFEIAKDWI